MAKPRNDELRDKIVATAAAMFLRDGYDNVKLKDIAQECGITTSLLQYYFPKRSDMVVQLSYGIIARVYAYIVEHFEGKLRSELGEDFDFGAAEVFFKVFYRILQADDDRLLRLYSVILYDVPVLKAGIDMMREDLGVIIWPGRSYRSKVATYALNGMIAQLIAIHFDQPLGIDLDWHINMAFEGYYAMVHVPREKQERISAQVEHIMALPKTEQFINEVLADFKD